MNSEEIIQKLKKLQEKSRKKRDIIQCHSKGTQRLDGWLTGAHCTHKIATNHKIEKKAIRRHANKEAKTTTTTSSNAINHDKERITTNKKNYKTKTTTLYETLVKKKKKQ